MIDRWHCLITSGAAARTPAKMNEYHYQRLEPGRIRLLKFRSEYDGGLDFSMETQRLESWFSSYIALSYRWIQSDEIHYIRVNDSYVGISPHLRDALVQIKARFASEWGALPIWVDAICINQADPKEKSAQVSMMGEIYSQATRVAAWLGQPSDDRKMRLAFEHLAFIREFALAAEAKSARLRSSQKTRDSRVLPAIDLEVQRQCNKLIGPEGSDAHIAWQGIKEIWENSWWRRVWIVQEGTVRESRPRQGLGYSYNTNSAKVYFLCGQHTTTWLHIGYSTAVAEALTKISTVAGMADFLKGAAVRNVYATWLIRDSRQKGHVSGLLAQLQLVRLRESTDPRDRVYACRALVSESTRQLIRPDYGRCMLDIYLDVVRIELQQSRSLDVLGYAMKLAQYSQVFSKSRGERTWPSWVPNWNDPLDLEPFHKKLYGYTRDIRRRPWLRQITLHGGWRGPDHDWYQNKMIENGTAYNASRNQPLEAAISGYELCVKGVRLDRVEDRHTFNDTSEEGRNRLNRWRAHQNVKYKNLEDFNRALFTTQVADVRTGGRNRAVAKGYVVDNKLLTTAHCDLTPAQRVEKDDMRASMNRARKDRGLCLTASGYIGLVPESTSKGDYICLLFGGQVLYVLRHRGSAARTYEYIGECYVHDLMDGEGMDWVKSGRASEENLTLS